MKLSVCGLTCAAAILWGGVVLLCAAANQIWPSYANVFLDCLASIYPGYHHDATTWSTVVVTLYALLDGAVGGFVFALLYNCCARCGTPRTETPSTTASSEG